MKKYIAIMLVVILTSISCTKMTTNNRIEGTWTANDIGVEHVETYSDGYIMNENGDTTYIYEVMSKGIIHYNQVFPNDSLGALEEYTIISISKKEMIIEYGVLGQKTWSKRD